MMLAAQGMGYQSCPMIGFDIEAVAKLINLPDDHVMGPMVAIGKGTKDAWLKPGQLPLADSRPEFSEDSDAQNNGEKQRTAMLGV